MLGTYAGFNVPIKVFEFAHNIRNGYCTSKTCFREDRNFSDLSLLVKFAVDTTYVPQLQRCCSICEQQEKRPDKNKAPKVFKGVWPQIFRIPTQITQPRWCKINNLQGSQQLCFVSRWISIAGKLIQVRRDLCERTVKYINTQDLKYRSGCAPSSRLTRLTMLRPNFKLYTDRSI